MEKLENSKRIMNSNWGRDLPPKIAKVIFSKLHFCNLPACRLVSQTWNHLVLDYASSSKFLPNALLLSTSDIVPNATPLSHNHWCNPTLNCIDIGSMTSVASFGFDGDWSNVFFINSCNGLLFICKSTYDTFWDGILNPMTNEFFEVPRHEIEEDIHSYGFGFSPATKQHKLFRITPIDHNQRDPSGSIMEVFPFGRSPTNHNQWRHVENLSFTVCGQGVYLNGVIYWVGKEKDKEHVNVIYALDVETETIESVAILEVGQISRTARMIKSFNGMVYAIVFMYSPCREVQVWRMVEKCSWVQDFVIDDISSDGLYQSLQQIEAFEDGGRLLFLIKYHLFCLDKTERKMKIIAMNSNERRVMNPNDRSIVGAFQLESLNFDSLLDILAGDN